MLNYSSIRKSHGSRVSQTLDSPIMFADIWELSEVLWALAVILIFGILFYSWILMSLGLTLTLIIGPLLKRKYNKGILIHYPYKKFGMNLPQLPNPGRARHFSD